MAKTENPGWFGCGFRSAAAVSVFFCCLATLALTGFPSEAQAQQSQSRICEQLANQLDIVSSTRSVGGNRAKYRQYDSAVRKQNNQINRAKRALRRNACFGAISRARARCRAIYQSLDKMQGNLANLKSERARHAPRQLGNERERRKILAAMQRNRCRSDLAAENRLANNQPVQKSRRRSILEQIFGVRAYNERGGRDRGYDTGADEGWFDRFGTYRTLCVRKTDGYYFPISFSTVPERFDFDEEICRNMCPSSDVALYVHRMPSEDSEDMVAYRTEVAYADEPFAFAYRKQHNPEYRCRFSTAGVSQGVDAEATGELENRVAEPRIGIPVFRKDRTLSPGGYDTLAEGLTVTAASEYLAKTRARKAGGDQIATGERKIRIVGPAFFPVQ